MFDITSLSLNETFEYVLKHPVTGEQLGDEGGKVVFTLQSKASPAYRERLLKIQNDRLKAQSQAKGKVEVTAEVIQKNSLDLLVAASLKASNFKLGKLTFDADDNSAAFTALYSDPKFSWVEEQIANALGDVSNFLA